MAYSGKEGVDMKYQKGYNYRLFEDESINTGWFIGKDIDTEYIKMTRSGLLTVKRGYNWDGASSVAIDTKNNMTPSLCHDAVFQLMRLEYLDQKYFYKANKLYRDMCIARGMWKARAEIDQWGLDNFASFACKPGYEPYPVLTAP